MQRIAAMALVVVGVVLVVIMPLLTESIGDRISGFFSGNLADPVVWAMIGGAVMAVVGVTIMVRACRGKS